MRSSLETISPADWPKGDYRPLATIRTNFENLYEESGIEFARVDEDGLGETHISALRTESGIHFILVDNVQIPGGRRVQIEVIHDGDLSAILSEIVRCLGLSETKLDWICENAHGAA